MLKLHDELIAELSNLLTTQNYNPVVVANHRLYARAFLDYLAECDMQVETVTPAQVDQYFVGHVRQRGVISAVALGHRQAAFAVMCSG